MDQTILHNTVRVTVLNTTVPSNKLFEIQLAIANISLHSFWRNKSAVHVH